ncbi:MAG: rod shape-determining protein MreC [Cyclobacteriaceae bacterium]|nr:rod shape-determining protein MreC [Cyclobacteriaceae bacterium]
MYQLLKLIHSYRAFLVLLFLELVCLWLLVRNNPYHSAAYFHTSNAVVGSFLETKSNISQFFSLPKVNEELANDNARLRESLAQSHVPIIVKTREDSLQLTNGIYEYGFLAAKVINNSTGLNHNYITINKGSANGVVPGMGVVSTNGVVGKVMSVSKNFATISSLLNVNVYVSAFAKRNNTFCSVNWDGKDPLTAKLKYVPRHIELVPGDTIVTSGYNAIFPENIPIGYVSDISLGQGASFNNIDVKLSNDFASLAFVYVIKNPRRHERITLENNIMQNNE